MVYLLKMVIFYSYVSHYQRVTSISGWWFGTFFIFPYIGNNHPNWLIFFRGVETTNQYIYTYIYIVYIYINISIGEGIVWETTPKWISDSPPIKVGFVSAGPSLLASSHSTRSLCDQTWAPGIFTINGLVKGKIYRKPSFFYHQI